jgi:alpha-L-fucosidase 2
MNVLLSSPGADAQPNRPLLWYLQPAESWEQQALPIGNGRLGAMVFGGVECEHLAFNEDSLWIGDELDTGAYQAFGDLRIHSSHSGATDYRRELDLSTAVHRVSYRSGGRAYQREYFSSHPAQVMVLRFTADRPGGFTGAVELTDAHGAPVEVAGNQLLARGSLSGHSAESLGKWARSSKGDAKRPYTVALDYEARVWLLAEGGVLEIRDGRLGFEGANALTILLAADTDYVPDRARGWKGEAPGAANQARLQKAADTPYADLLADHQRDYRSLFDRVTVDLGCSPAERGELPTDRRLLAYRQDEPHGKKTGVSPDPELEALVYQYGRYLMISSSRAGDLPANLQGIWNASNQPEWRCDYHSDVNLQMNYWFVDQANLPGCFSPLAEWLWAVIPVKREATAKLGKRSGWGLTSENGLFGGGSYHFVDGDAAWLAQNIWDHFAFTQDREYLGTRAYPILKELCRYWQDQLEETPDGQLVGPKSISPEHGPSAAGNAYEQQLVYELFTNTVEAAQILGVDAEFQSELSALRDRLAGPQIGSWGQLLEWREELGRPEFEVSARWEKAAGPVIHRLVAEEGKKSNTAVALAWERFAPAIRQRLLQDTRDVAALAEGLNALAAGPSLFAEPALSEARTEALAEMQACAADDPLIRRWINWSLLVGALSLDGFVTREDTPRDTHRHTSHLIAVFPGRQVTPERTPELARAAARSLLARGEAGDSRREWVWVWRSALWARLGDSARAWRCLAGLLSHNMMPNLLQTHPPFQIDGSFGYAAAVGEMLLQSHERGDSGIPVIHLLPALPVNWPEGSFRGLRARGGFTVDAAWKDGKLLRYRIVSDEPRPVRVRSGNTIRTITSGPDFVEDPNL